MRSNGFSRWIDLMTNQRDGVRPRPRLPGGGASGAHPRGDRVDRRRSPSSWTAPGGPSSASTTASWSAMVATRARLAPRRRGHARSGRPTTALRGSSARGGGPVRAARGAEPRRDVHGVSPRPEGGTITFISPQIQDLLGVSAGAAGGGSDLVVGNRASRRRRAGPGGERPRVRARARNSIRSTACERPTAAGCGCATRRAPSGTRTGEILYWQGFMVDVSEQVEAEGRLRQAEARYRAMVELIPAVTYTDSRRRRRRHDRWASSAHRWRTSSATRRKRFLDDGGFWFELMHPDDLAHLRSIDAFNNSDLEPFDHEYRMRHADGHWVWVHDISTAVLDEEGNLDYFLGFLTDVSSRHDAEERLREAELTFRTMVEQNPAVFYVQEIDPDDPDRGRITDVRRTGRRGADRVSATGDRGRPRALASGWSHPDDRERVFAADAASNTDGSDAFSAGVSDRPEGRTDRLGPRRGDGSSDRRVGLPTGRGSSWTSRRGRRPSSGSRMPTSTCA